MKARNTSTTTRWETIMTLHRVVSREDWLAEHKALLARRRR
jgi:hypothetical protein